MALTNRPQAIVWPHALVIALALVLVLGYGRVVAAAEELPREAPLPLTLASKAAAAAPEKCKQYGDRGRRRAGRSSGRRLRPGRAGQHRRGAQGAASGSKIRCPSS